MIEDCEAKVEQLQYWLGFNMVKGIGPAKVRRLLEHFGTLQEAWEATPLELAAAGLDRRSLESLQAARSRVQLEQLVERLSKVGARALTWEMPDYPRNLLNIEAPPPVLFVKGELRPEDDWAVAMVGTRQATHYGREAARELAVGLAANGVTVVSGLARGIDAVAHRAALEAGGRTIAVLGCGLDTIYPAEHQELAQAIQQAGAIVSDYALGTPPDAANFPPRNRIISGLAKGVVVVEAGEESGALITTEFAIEQGREVFAVPGNITQRASRGPNKLIQNGAKLVQTVNDILEELNLTFVTERQEARTALPTDATEQKVLAQLAAGQTHIDELCTQLSLPVAQLSGTLAMMELKGLVRQVGGMNYIVAKEARAEYKVD